MYVEKNTLKKKKKKKKKHWTKKTQKKNKKNIRVYLSFLVSGHPPVCAILY